MVISRSHWPKHRGRYAIWNLMILHVDRWAFMVKAENPHGTYGEERMCFILINSVWQREAIHRRKRRFWASVRYSLKIYLGFMPSPLPTPRTHIHKYQVQWCAGLENHMGPEEGGAVLTSTWFTEAIEFVGQNVIVSISRHAGMLLSCCQ